MKLSTSDSLFILKIITTVWRSKINPGRLASYLEIKTFDVEKGKIVLRFLLFWGDRIAPSSFLLATGWNSSFIAPATYLSYYLLASSILVYPQLRCSRCCGHGRGVSWLWRWPRGRPSNPGKRCSLTAAEKEMVHERYVNGIIHNPVPHDGATVVGIMVDGLGIILYYIFETLGEAGKMNESA